MKRRILKLLKVTSAAVIFFVIILFSASYFLQDKLAGVLINYINKKVSVKIETGSLRFSMLSHFPAASLELRNVLVRPSKNFDHLAFPGIGTDTLLSARSVSVGFSMIDIFRGRYNIERVGIKSGKIYLLTDQNGKVNYEIGSSKNEGSGGNFELNLEEIRLTDITAVYSNLTAKLLLKAVIENGKLKSSLSSGKTDLLAYSSGYLNLIRLSGTVISGKIATDLELDLHSSGDTTTFRRGVLKMAGMAFGLKGNILPGSIIDLNLTGQKIDIEQVLDFFPDSLRLRLKNYDPAGKMRIAADFKGPVSGKINPHIEITALLEKGRIRNRNSRVSVNDLSFSGYFSNGSMNASETSTLSFENVVMKLGSSWINGSYRMTGLNNPVVALTVKGTARPAELKDFFNLSAVTKAGGSADADLEMKQNITPAYKYSFNELLSSVTRADINFRDFSLAIENSGFDVSAVNGNIRSGTIITTDNLSFSFRDHNITIDKGKFENFPGWLAESNDLPLSGSADVSMNRMDPLQLFRSEPASGNGTGNEVIIPSRFDLNLDFRIDTFSYKTFRSEQVRGSLHYKRREMNFTSLRFNSLEGLVTGNGTFYQNTDNSVIVKGLFNIQNININKAFLSFRNFGQEFIKAENLAGTLSGTLSLLLPMGATLEPEIKYLTAEGKYVIRDGSLINFEPVKKLSSYIELSELQNIRFERLENDFYIRNNFFYVPQMDINSSAVTLTVNGKHSFDNDYIYHVKMLLSEVLSKKFGKKKASSTEFGPVQDDGLGRTSLLLKIEGKGDVVKTGYDISAAKAEIKTSVKSEKKNLKTILREEYGWYKNDSTIRPEQTVKEEKKPRFRVTWDENKP